MKYNIQSETETVHLYIQLQHMQMAYNTMYLDIQLHTVYKLELMQMA